MSATAERVRIVRHGLRLEYATLSYNVVEAVVAMAAGGVAGSIALIGFGIDAVIESVSGATMLWRLNHDDHPERDEIERRAQKIIAVSFFLLAAYVGWESVESLVKREAAERSITGICLAAASLCIMPLLARAKRKVGRNINSPAMVADSKQTELCSYLSGILLLGLASNAMLGWWWADAVAALVMAPIIVREGWAAWQGQGCGCHGTCIVPPER